MEVSGKKLFSKQDSIPCKPCSDHDCYTLADGFCGECEEYMCNTCFVAHKKFKIGRGHTLTDPGETAVKEEEIEDLEKCDSHYKDMIKFYCPQHEQVGCGDCMILEHKACKVEYIRDKASNFKDSKEFKDLIKGAETCHQQAKEISSSIKNNKAQVKDINEKFKRDVNMFKEEMIAHITELTNAMLKLGENMETMDIKSMEQLEKENDRMMDEISKLTTEIESQLDKPNKLFVNSIKQKPKLKKLQDQIEGFKNRNKIDMYEFKRDENIDRSIKGCKQLGNLQKVKQRKEADLQEEIKPMIATMQKLQASVSPKAQPLLDRQLTCRNLAVDGGYLSYVDSGNGDTGLYVDKEIMSDGSYFEVEILSMGQGGNIAIGVVEDLEWEWRFQACDGKVYRGSNFLESTGQICSVGDRIGCGLYFDEEYWYVVFTRNGNKIAKKSFLYLEGIDSLYAAIGMNWVGDKVRVILDAKMPAV